MSVVERPRQLIARAQRNYSLPDMKKVHDKQGVYGTWRDCLIITLMIVSLEKIKISEEAGWNLKRTAVWMKARKIGFKNIKKKKKFRYAEICYKIIY